MQNPTTVKDSFKNKNNVCSNVISSLPIKPISPRTIQFDSGKAEIKVPANLPLVHEILAITRDTKSSKYWIKIVRKLPEDEIRQYLSHLTIAMNEKFISRPGAYLNSLVLANHPELKRSEEKTQPQTQYQRYIEPEEPVGEVASEEFSRASIADIKAILNRKVG